MGDIALHFREAEKGKYATCRIQKGLLLAFRQEDLSEEGMGFGVPVVGRRHGTIFPGSAHLTGNGGAVTVDYDLNLVERMAVKGRKIDSRTFYRIKEFLSLLHREHPRLRKVLTHASSRLRHVFGMETLFEKNASLGIVRVHYFIHESGIRISVDAGKLKKSDRSEVMLMNEQGAGYFSTYHDSCGLFLEGNAIGTWDETFADEASFLNPHHGIEFAVQKVHGSRLFRGRERVKKRLAWSGLACSMPQGAARFDYDIAIRCR